MRNKYGFTLIELLAVIVVLAVIALISVPILLNVIDKSKRGALQDSAYGIIEAGELYYAQNLSSNEDVTRYDFEVKNNEFVNSVDNTKKLSFKGSMPKTGTLQINSNGKTAVAICTDKYCACKSVSELKVTVQNTNCNINSETGEIENILNESTTNDGNPIGTVISYMGNNAPIGYLKCDGQIYNISEYQTLANQIKNEFGFYNYYGGNGTTTFAVPNLQGEFLRGYSSNSSNSVTTGVSTANIGKHQDGTQHVLFYKYSDNHLYFNNYNTTVRAQNQDSKIGNLERTRSYINATGKTTASGGQPILYTSRPTNTSVLYCIKY